MATILWAGDAALNAAQCAQIVAWGFDTVMLHVGWLIGAGGTNAFIGSVPPIGAAYNFQRSMASFIPRAHAAGLKVILGFYLDNYNNIITPMVDWFDDVAWAKFLPNITALAAAAHFTGCDGLAIDPEMYHGGSWGGVYGGHTLAQTQLQAKKRGIQFMAAINAGFPSTSIFVYQSSKAPLPGLYLDKLHAYLNGGPIPPYTAVSLDFFAGIQALGGFTQMQFFDPTFYKPGNIEGGPYRNDPDKGWARAMQDDVNGFAALDWSSACHISPFLWFDADTGGGDGTYGEYVWTEAELALVFPALLAHMQNNSFAIYQYNPILTSGSFTFSYAPYNLLAAKRPVTPPTRTTKVALTAIL